MDLVATRRDGTEFPVEISLSPIETITGTLIICAIRDVTVQRTAQRAAERAKLASAHEANEHLVVGAVRAQMVAEQAEQDSHLKDEFLATVSHELRTPLNAILGWARMLESKQLPLSARNTPCARALAAGFQAHAPKPVEPAALSAAIAAITAASEARRTSDDKSAH